MASDDETKIVTTGNSSNDMSEKFERFLHTLQQPNQQQTIPQSIAINVKLNRNNFPIWSRLMKVAVGGRGKLWHLTGNLLLPATDSADFPRWEENDLTICSWLLDNMEPELMMNYAQIPSAKKIWDTLAETYGQIKEGVEVFDLTMKAYTMGEAVNRLRNFTPRYRGCGGRSIKGKQTQWSVHMT